MPHLQTMNCTLDSVEEFSSALDGSGWQADFRQLDRGCEPVGLQVAATGTLALLRVDLANRIHQQGLPTVNNVTFGLPTQPQASGRIGRRVLDSETLTCFDPVSGMDIISPPGFSAYTLSFDKRHISELACMLELPGLSESYDMLGTQRVPSREALTRWRQMLGNLFSLVEQGNERLVSIALRELESDLPLQLLRTWYLSETVPYVPASNRSQALRKVLEYITESDGE